jgi:hypothetical protein
MKKFFGQTGIFALPVLLLALGASTASVAASNESDAAKIKRATRAAPRSITDEATIMDADGTILRQGTNEWTCFPGVPLIPGDKHPMCNDPVWMEWLFALFMGEYPTPPDTIGMSYMLLGDALVNNADPGATDPDDGGPWIQEGPHLMLLFPNQEFIAHYPRDPHAGGPYVMWDNTPLVHVMVPVK